MPSIQSSLRVSAAALASAITLAVPLSAQTDGLAMLDGLSKGEWTLSFRDDTPGRKVCLRNGRELIQIQHEVSGCNRYVVEDGNAEVTVQYTCPGEGYGRTNIRRESGSLVQIESQGFAAGLPFQLSAEARRTGTC